MNITNEKVIELAMNLGFDLVGLAKAEELTDDASMLEHWIEHKYYASMSYIPREKEKRKKVNLLLPGAKSVISFGQNYYNEENDEKNSLSGKISKYAWGKDYHVVLGDKLKTIISGLKEIDNGFEAEAFVDSGPILQKAWAIKAGLGWRGKNSIVISPEIGSWFFIGTIISNQEFEYSKQINDLCGSCSKCIDSCPNKAITEHRMIDANKCIAYWNIESKGDIPEELKGKMDGWLFGCDICQDVCPWNNKLAVKSKEPAFIQDTLKALSLDDVDNMSKEEFIKLFGNNSIKRTKLKNIKRNAKFLEGIH